MRSRNKVLLGIFGVYFVLIALVVVIFGATRRDNPEFLPQNEFKLDTWVDLPGPLDINKAVMYLFIAGILTIGTMVFIARRMQARPNRVQTLVEVIYAFMRDQITGSAMDDKMAAQVVPVPGHALPLHLVLEPDRLHPAADQHGAQLRPLRGEHPLVRALRGHGEHLDPARARARRVRLLHRRGDPRQGLHRLPEEPDPRGRHRLPERYRCSCSSSCRTSCACSRCPCDSSPTSSPAT